MRIRSDADLLNEALGYIYYYNNLREHSSLEFKTPFSYLKAQLPDIDDKIRFVIPIMLDKVAVELGPWSGYYVLAQHPLILPQGRVYGKICLGIICLNIEVRGGICYRIVGVIDN